MTFDDYAAPVAAFDTNGSGDFDSDEEVAAALTAGAAEDIGVIKSVECPVIRLLIEPPIALRRCNAAINEKGGAA